MKACFTGHRKLGFECTSGIELLVKEAQNQGVDEFLIGMAVGIDQVVATYLSRQELRWHAIIPCANQDSRWSAHQKFRYRKLLERAESQTILYLNYVPGCFHARNKYMVNSSSMCLAVWNGTQAGGTWETIKMAIAANKMIIQWNPITTEIIYLNSQQLSIF